ncbi:MAG: D-alanyl-D-alanine carboxypeptidase/D-alanyl-D-alanine-endopeptidase [Holophagales bacterium]|nr:D-alanyl-D-alanine carboxypeptidase/D-alanyl-D-alanine-endopeptidase [Holophagales bacterium]
MRGNEVVAEERADQLFTPASVAKLVVTAAALHHLGLDHRATTGVSLAGSVHGSELRGDLVVRAGGDPTWSRRFLAEAPRAPLERVAGELRRRGIRRITGDLVIDVSAFPGRPFPTSRASGDVAFAFGAPTSALAVDENTIEVEIAPGAAVESPARIRSATPDSTTGSAPGFTLRSLAVTVGRERHGEGTVDFQAEWDGPELVIRGEYPISEPPYRLAVAVGDGSLHAGRALGQILGEKGIVVGGRARVSHQPAAGTVILELRSPPLSEWLEPILADSHNWLSEMLLRQLAHVESGEGRDQIGLEILSRFLEEEVMLDSESFFLEDASGLSPFDLLTPRAVVDLLRWVWRQPWRDIYIRALAAPGKGTLATWPGLPPGARAKTGTLTHTLGLAGYLLPPGAPREAEPLVFACMLNHRTEDRPSLRRELVGRIRGFER